MYAIHSTHVYKRITRKACDQALPNMVAGYCG